MNNIQCHRRVVTGYMTAVSKLTKAHRLKTFTLYRLKEIVDFKLCDDVPAAPPALKLQTFSKYDFAIINLTTRSLIRIGYQINYRKFSKNVFRM